ncbi:hypothetical protein LUZ60_012690 [Juncus effusus]|nr:hypothetical protein LUZ60_012690 [Juncus effusus]
MGLSLCRPIFTMDAPSPPSQPSPMSPPSPQLPPSLSPPSSQTQPPPMSDSQIDAIQDIIGYKFSNRKLVEEAMTHPSFYYPVECSTAYQRLEYLGDAILNSLVALEQFKTYPGLQPGHLTRLRAANVDKEKLARTAIQCGLHKHLRHNAPQLGTQIDNFIKEMDQYPFHSNGLLDVPKSLGDSVESLLGAVFIDSNYSYETVWKIFNRLADPFITPETLGRHPVTELNELCQKHRKTLKFDPQHWDIDTTIDVLINGELIGSAMYGLKKEVCQNRAAKVALNRLKKELVNKD